MRERSLPSAAPNGAGSARRFPPTVPPDAPRARAGRAVGGPAVTTSIHQRIADELGVREGQVRAAVELLDGGATVPFVARYRKEATGALDDTQLRTLEERLGYLRELEERRAAI